MKEFTVRELVRRCMVTLKLACGRVDRVVLTKCSAKPVRRLIAASVLNRIRCRQAPARPTVRSGVVSFDMPHLQSPLESGAAGIPPPSTDTARCSFASHAYSLGHTARELARVAIQYSFCRVTDQVRFCNWQDPGQQEQAVAELQDFCSASIKSLSLESFTPLLLKGAVAEWPAVDKWSLDWLVEQYGEQR